MAAEHVADNPYALFGDSVAEAQPAERAAFIRRTYTHLAAAVYAFAALEWLYFSTPIAESFMDLLGTGSIGLLIMFGLFLGVSWLADSWARSNSSPALQYAGLGLYVVMQSLLCAPLLWYAQSKTIAFMTAPGQTPVEVPVIGAAGVATVVMFAGLTAIAWFSGANFSFLRAGLALASIAAFGLMIASFVFGMHLGVWFSVAMITLAAGYILYDTSNVLHEYRPDQHVAASLALFASVALLFLYLLRFFVAMSSRE